MKRFLRENFWWLLLAIITISLLVPTFYLPDTDVGEKIEKILLFPFDVIGAVIILIGIGTIIQYFDEKNYIKHTWQGVLTFLILALSIIVLAL